jgi:hypothetical protein
MPNRPGRLRKPSLLHTSRAARAYFVFSPARNRGKTYRLSARVVSCLAAPHRRRELMGEGRPPRGRSACASDRAATVVAGGQGAWALARMSSDRWGTALAPGTANRSPR